MPAAVAIWICSCAYLNCAGWCLSAMGQLNAGGYAVALILWLAALAIWGKGRDIISPQWPQKLLHRYSRIFPAAYLVLAGLAFVGGALYAPDNVDELGYRFPRILHWFAAGHWHWIHTPVPSMNDRPPGFEWLMAPLFAFTRSDRLFFLPNIVCFLLLPGLIYSVFIRLGISRKVAWHWMWVLPLGFNYALQAGSVASDMIGVIFALAAMDGALRFAKSRRQSDLWLSILAAGLTTGVKISNIPLLLPWLVALLYAFRDLWRKPLALAVILLITAFSSFLPMAMLNVKYCGDWTGSNIENPRLRLHNPLVGIAGNAVVLGLINLQPPVVPLSRTDGEKLAHFLIPQKFLNFYDANFEGADFTYYFASGIQTEEGSSLGVGIWCLWIGSAIASLFYGRVRPKTGSQQVGNAISHKQRIILLILPWVALLVFMANSGMGERGRLLSPYYALLVPLLLISPAQEWIVQSRLWKWWAAVAYLMAAMLIVLTPSRPLLPVQTLLQNCDRPFLVRARTSYAENVIRSDELAPIKTLIPSGTSVVGLVASSDELSLWRPFGTRRVVYVLPGDTGGDLAARGVDYVILSREYLKGRNEPVENWLNEHNAELKGEMTITNASPPYVPFGWYVAVLRP